MRIKINNYLKYSFAGTSDVLLAIEVIPMADQHLIQDQMNVSSGPSLHTAEGVDGLGRRTWITNAEGILEITYQAEVDILRQAKSTQGVYGSEHEELPPYVIPYLFASRYCESDNMVAFVQATFPQQCLGDKIDAMSQWINQNLTYAHGVSNETTTASDTFFSRRGVCRDFAHLLIAFVRAAGVPARMVSVYAPEVMPPDFHAVVEVWLNGEWFLVDPTGLAPVDHMARMAVGRDATDISFMTIFGAAEMLEQNVDVSFA
ncbi:transglutaminase-like domain-containing protein [Hirschia baltica]|uniref:Transglutaminase domain protein n=1 Tax=Hirschia baltica (strain ATCC 49814 / DSM 5838 / IFAM 1418) TaxID=582402 RepID=C6XQ48_HIRBI|nr:transglutaminase family protein [Hirschia baltica]ACT58565.1 transglutaminase domain protein [Hirschia baltica ATCC 49814]